MDAAVPAKKQCTTDIRSRSTAKSTDAATHGSERGSAGDAAERRRAEAEVDPAEQERKKQRLAAFGIETSHGLFNMRL